VSSLRSSISRRMPGVAWRDEELARRQSRVERLRTRVDELEQQAQELEHRAEELRAEVARRVEVDDYLSRASFYRHIAGLRRTTVELRRIDPGYRHPLRHLPFKLRNYRLAASHGIPVPSVLRTWSTVTGMDLDPLPDAFVVKSDGGAGSHGVLPLRRVAPDRYETVEGARSFTGDQVRDHFAERVSRRSISGPFFAEELLTQPGGGPIPDDVKVYAFHGDVQQILLRRMGRHGDLRTLTRRYVTGDGSDLGEILDGVPVDPQIPVPSGLEHMVGIARHISRAAGVPFVRVDLFDTDQGPVLGEVTRAPGGNQQFVPRQDERLGRAWEHAAYRLDLDVLAGRPPGVLHGDRPVPNPYPPDHVSRSDSPGPWAPVVVSCDAWCHLRQEG
jgi:hypothetical protein